MSMNDRLGKPKDIAPGKLQYLYRPLRYNIHEWPEYFFYTWKDTEKKHCEYGNCYPE